MKIKAGGTRSHAQGDYEVCFTSDFVAMAVQWQPNLQGQDTDLLHQGAPPIAMNPLRTHPKLGSHPLYSETSVKLERRFLGSRDPQ
jgi:hypothetical protein